ncbi:hypothetical protein PGB90_006736 [Kerria lacca]
MVVLDSNFGMLSNTNNENHYIIPDPVTLPPTLDAKNSPLALLAQTCSQIGADSSNTKPLLSSLERKKSSSTTSNSSNERSPSGGSLLKSHSESKSLSENKSPENKLAFKPYELNVLTRKTDSTRPPSSHAAEIEDRKSNSRASSRKSASASPHVSTPNEKSSSSPSSITTETKSQTPVDASSLSKPPSSDLYVSLKDSASSFKPPFSLSPLNNFNCNGCPTLPLDPTNPAFRNVFANSTHLPHPSLLDAACFQSSSPSPYISYTRVKTPTGSEAVVPVCKDPYCFSCRFTLHGSMGPCPPGCVQCDQKYSAAAAAAMLMSNPFGAYQYGRPNSCNWLSQEQCCGKRFRNSEELLQHLKTHANTNDPIALMNHLRYSPGAVNPLAAAAAASRYHPYSKPGLPASLAASPFSAFNPTLSPYYPPYSLYDQRIGAAVNP